MLPRALTLIAAVCLLIGASHLVNTPADTMQLLTYEKSDCLPSPTATPTLDDSTRFVGLGGCAGGVCGAPVEKAAAAGKAVARTAAGVVGNTARFGKGAVCAAARVVKFAVGHERRAARRAARH